jgi:hypothetical protein
MILVEGPSNTKQCGMRMLKKDVLYFKNMVVNYIYGPAIL